MAKLASLLEYYYETMYEELKGLEEHRLEVLRRVQMILFVVIGLGIIAFVTLDRYFHAPLLQSALGVGVVCFSIYLFFYHRQKSEFAVIFKEQVIQKIIHFIDSTLFYQKEGSISEMEYKQSELFLDEYDRFNGSDLVQGSIEGVKVRFGMLHTEKKVKRSKGEDEWETIFQGIFFMADFNKYFHSKVVVLPDVAEKTLGLLGSWMQSMNISRDKLMKMDHVEFEKEFVIYGNDPIETRYILSHSLMQKIVDFRKKVKKPLHISFIHSKICIAISYNQAPFEPDLSRSLLEFSYIKEYFEVLNLMISIVDELKLDEKLWSKR